MEEKILKELENINVQLKQMNQRFDGVDQRFEGIDQRFEKIDQRFEKIDQRFEKIDQRFEKIDQRFEEIEQKIEKTEDRIVTTLRDEFDKKLNETIEAISADVGTQINELCVKIEERDNREHSKILNELREHKRRTKRGVEAFGRILVC